MDNLLPLTVVIPLAAAFLIPMMSLITRERDWPVSEAIALLAAIGLLAIAIVSFGFYGPSTVWIGKYKGGSELLGLVGRPLEEREASGGRLVPRQGVVVETVAGGSAAERSGIREGDVITAWRRESEAAFLPLRTMNELRRQNAATQPHEQLVLRLVRDGTPLEATLDAGKSVTGIAMFCDGLTRLMLIVIGVVSLAAVLFSLSYMRPYTKLHLYYCPMMLMVAGMMGVVVSGDLFNIYVFLEVAAVASYALVGYGVESEELEASFKYLVLSAVASGFILLGIGIIYSLRGTLNLAQIAEFMPYARDNNAMWLALAFFMAGFGLKAAMVPFHAWLPDAHPSAPAPVSAMLSGLLIKASGLYVLARLVFNVFGPSASAAHVMMVMGALSMVVGGLLMWGQEDFKRMLAYSSIMHVGLVMLAFGVGAEALALRDALSPRWGAVAFVAVFAGVFHLVNHATFKSLLFLVSGSLVYRTGARDLSQLSGICKKMPWTGLFARIGALSISGVPPFNGFFSKLLIVVAVVWAGHWLLGALTVFVSLLALLAFIKVQRCLLDEEPLPRFSNVRESPLPMQAAMAILAAACVGLGVLLPLHMAGFLEPATQSLVGQLTGYAAAVFGG